MKKMRKLIPALAMLLVSAVMMSTASFAWFSMSTQATASGMSVQAVADAGILISNGGGAWTSSATATTASANLRPVNTKDGSAWYWTTSTNAADANVGKTTNTFTPVTPINETTNYFLYNKFYIKSSSTNAVAGVINLSNIEITESEDYDLNEAARVLVKCGTNYYIYSMSARTYKVVTVTSGTVSMTEFTSTADGAQTAQLFSGNVPAVSADAAGAVAVEVYVYYEGEDANCFSNNLKDAVATISVSLAFTFVAA